MKKSYLTNIPAYNTSTRWRGWLWGVFMMAMLALPFTAQAQQTISGTVKDNTGGGLPGVSVLIKGTTQGTTTDVDGKYQISAKAGDILVATLTGYKDAEMTVGTETTIDFTLEEGGILDEVVVVGYTTQDRKDVTGSVSRIGAKDFNQGPITNPLQQISGRAAGVTVTQVGSEPGTAPSVRIRGITSLQGGNDPLVIVDGIQGGMDLLNQVPPSEIETFDILKDASATAIYGSRGAAGVILITTKKGKAGKTTVEYNGVASFETVAKKYEVLNAAEWRAEATRRGFNMASVDFGGNTDWFDQLTRPYGFTQNHNLAFGGGTDKFNYRASLTGILQDGLVINSGSNTYMGRIQATQHSLNDKLTITYNLNVATIEKKFNGPGIIQRAYNFRPTNPVYFSNGEYFRDTIATRNRENPYARAKEIIDGQVENQLFGSARLDYEIFEGLTASAFGSWRKTDLFYGSYESWRTTTEAGRQDYDTTATGVARGIAQRRAENANERLLNLMLNYNKTFGDHNIQGLFVYEWQKRVFENFGSTTRGFVNDLTTLNDLDGSRISYLKQGDQYSMKEDRKNISFLLRANYGFKNRYLATVSLRRDGASVFGKNHRWGYFPSASLAWRVTEEEFFKNQKIFQNLKVRAGFGVTGNQQGLGPLNSVRLVSNDGAGSFALSQNDNPDLRWETREMFNAGIDFEILDSKLFGTIDFYTGNTRNLLFDYAVPQPPYPFNTVKANVGTMSNTGLEIGLNYKLIDTDDLKVNLGGNFTTNKNTVKKLSGELNGVPLKRDSIPWSGVSLQGVAGNVANGVFLMEGQPVGAFFVMQHAGVDDQGNQLYADRNGDGVLDQTMLSKDRYVAGQALPKFTYAFTPSASYKNFDLNLVFRGAHGHKVYNSRLYELSEMATFGTGNVVKSALALNMNGSKLPNDFWLEKADFFRCDNLTLGYRFATGNSKYMDNVRLSFTVNNVFVITGYKGLDPELRLDGGGGFGVDGGIYPRTRNFAFGVNVMLK